MELRLEDGKYVNGKFQGLDSAGGLDEIMQRIYMKLIAKKGSFYPLPSYGSRLHALSGMLPSQRKTAAKQFVLEALSDEQGLELVGLELITKTADELCISVEFCFQGGDNFTVETKI